MSAANFDARLSSFRSQSHQQAAAGKSPSAVLSAPQWIMGVASAIGLVTSIYLAWASLSSSALAGCGQGAAFDCSNVLHSKWSTIASVPVSIPASALHLSVLALLAWNPRSRRQQAIRWNALGFAALSAGAGALWFIGLQVFALGHICPYCMVVHVAGLVLATAFFLTGAVGAKSLKQIGAFVVVSLAAFIGVQSFNAVPTQYDVIEYPENVATSASEPTNASSDGNSELFESPTTNASPELFEAPSRPEDQTSLQTAPALRALLAVVNPAILLQAQVEVEQQAKPNKVRLLSNVELDTNAWPLIGRTDAEMVFVEMFDYTCPHCQKTHKAVEEARKKLGDKLAIMTLPVPLDGKCNPTVQSTHSSHAESCDLSKLAISVWLVEPIKFDGFHSFLMEETPSYTQAVAKAKTVVDAARLDEILRSKTPGEYIGRHVSLYQRAGSGTIPKLLFPNATVVGAVESPTSLLSLIEKHLK